MLHVVTVNIRSRSLKFNSFLQTMYLCKLKKNGAEKPAGSEELRKGFYSFFKSDDLEMIKMINIISNLHFAKYFKSPSF